MWMRDPRIHMTRKDAINDIRIGRGIQLTHVGRFTTFRVILRRSPIKGGSVQACIDCPRMRRTYYINLTTKQVMSYIRRHYPRHVWEQATTELDPFPATYKEVA